MAVGTQGSKSDWSSNGGCSFMAVGTQGSKIDWSSSGGSSNADWKTDASVDVKFL